MKYKSETTKQTVREGNEEKRKFRSRRISALRNVPVSKTNSNQIRKGKLQNQRDPQKADRHTGSGNAKRQVPDSNNRTIRPTGTSRMRKKRPRKLAQVTGDRETSGLLNGDRLQSGFKRNGGNQNDVR